MFILENAIKHQNLLATRMAMRLKNCSRRPTHEGHMFRARGMQRHHLKPPYQAWNPASVVGIDHQLLLISRVHLLQLDQDRATLVCPVSIRLMGGVNLVDR